MSFSLITSCKLASTELTGERFFSRVCADMRGQVVTAAEGAHAYSALERFVTCMDAKVTRELVRAREASVTVLCRTSMWPFVDWGFAGTVGVLPWPNRF